MAHLSDFDYELPPELVAQDPLARRDASRLLHLFPDGHIEHRAFRELPEVLLPGDLLVLNDTKVFPARLLGRRENGGTAELFLLESVGQNEWRVLAKPARKLEMGTRVVFEDGRLEALVIAQEQGGRRIVRFDFEGVFDDLLDDWGATPLPPYIATKLDEEATRERYQTVYARRRGSVAAPTAGMHFTEEIFERLEACGVGTCYVTLHVGYATFEPIRAERIEEHRMGVERFEVPGEVVERIGATRSSGGKVVAVGTTTVRALESAARGAFPQGWSETDLFIKPGFRFRVVDALLTNFHLPKSTLLLLVAALGGEENLRHAYLEAVERRYRFYSFGDAMLVYPALSGSHT